MVGLGQAQLHFIALISKNSVATPNDKVREFLRTFRSFQWQSEEVSILSVDKSQWHVRDMSTLQVMTLKSNVITRGLVRPSQKTGHHGLCDALRLILWPSSYSKTQSKWGLTVDTYFCPRSRKGKVRWWKHKNSTWQRISYKITNLNHPSRFTRNLLFMETC